jgi:hypothetical protein
MPMQRKSTCCCCCCCFFVFCSLVLFIFSAQAKIFDLFLIKDCFVFSLLKVVSCCVCIYSLTKRYASGGVYVPMYENQDVKVNISLFSFTHSHSYSNI